MEVYTYTPLNLEEPAFRLVRLFSGLGPRLQCEIVHALLAPEDVMDYEAVSYTWGQLAKSIIFHIEVHGETIQKLNISPNLYHLLLDLRNPDTDRMLWIDAICINQDAQDAAERNHQVRQMARIYGQAQRVVVWLGPSTHEKSLAMGSLVELQKLYKDMNWKTHEIQASAAWNGVENTDNQDQNNPRYIGLEQIFDHPWFQRIWILQEVRNARSALICCGKNVVSSTIFALAPSLFKISVGPHCQSVLDLMPGSPGRSKMLASNRDLWTLLRQFREAKATIEHDNIYALLGLCSEETEGLRVSYEQPISTVISEVVSHICHYELARIPDPLYHSIKTFQADLDRLHENVLVRMARTGLTDNLQSILEQQGEKANKLIITPRVIIEAVSQNVKLPSSILQQVKRFNPTELLIAAFNSQVQIGDSLYFIFDQANKANITEEVIMAAAAARTGRYNTAIIGSILEKADNSFITEKVIIEAIRNEEQSRGVVNLIIKLANKAVLTERVLIELVCGQVLKIDSLDLYIQRAGEFAIRERVVTVAIRSDIATGNGCSECLLRQCLRPIRIKRKEIQKLVHISNRRLHRARLTEYTMLRLLLHHGATAHILNKQELLNREYYVYFPEGTADIWSNHLPRFIWRMWKNSLACNVTRADNMGLGIWGLLQFLNDALEH